jgi:orotidine-5'-phosphate decarboxylase
MPQSFTSRVAGRVLEGLAPAVVGLDPRLEALPARLAPAAAPAERITAFYREVLPRLRGRVPAVKPNIAFFEVHGAPGWAAYEETCRLARAADLAVIADVKRGDVGSTAEAYAAAHFRHADAVTLHPLLGKDSMLPFLERCRNDGRAVFVLVRTSNPSAGEFQDLPVGPARTLTDALADAVHRWGEGVADEHGYSPVGAVVGATWPAELARLRARLPAAWLLIPGVGAQGGRIADLAPAFDGRGLGALVAQSRGILQCFAPDDVEWRDRIDAAVEAFTKDLRALSASGAGS